MTKMFYDIFHKKNSKIQKKLITDKNYTYQSLILLIRQHFTKKGKVLDFGCGVGTIDFYLASKGFNTTGVDISENAIEMAIKNSKFLKLNERVNFIRGDEGKLKSLTDFDYLICSEVLEHLPDDREVIGRLSEVVKINGIAIFSVPSINAPLYRMGLLDSFDKEVGHLRRYTDLTLSKLLVSNGFKVLNIYKTEGLLRNSLYTIPGLGIFVKFVRWPFTIIVNIVDDLFVKMLGESNIYIVASKE
jgi:SAM-dependent methyltransferase